MLTRRRDRTLLMLFMVLLMFFVAAQGGMFMRAHGPASVSINCIATWSMEADAAPAIACANINSQIGCSMSCASPYTGMIGSPTNITFASGSPQHDCPTPFLGRMVIAPDPYPPKLAALS